MKTLKVISPPTVYLEGYEIKISENDYDGSVLVIAKNDILKYFSIKYFPDVEQARKWYNNLGCIV